MKSSMNVTVSIITTSIKKKQIEIEIELYALAER